MKFKRFIMTSWKPALAGLSAGAMTILVLQIGKALDYRILNPNLLFALAVVWSAYQGGKISGLCTVFIAIVYTMIDWSVPGHLFSYSTDNLQRLVIVFICMPIMAVLVGILKSQSDVQQKTLSIYLTLEKEKNRHLTEALSNKKLPEGALPVCAWCRRARQDDGRWVNLDEHLQRQYAISITHGICKDCTRALGKP